MGVSLGQGSAPVGEVRESADFREVYDLLRQHLPGMTEAELNSAAVRGLVSSLGPNVSLAGGKAAPDGSMPVEGPLVSQRNVFDDAVGYVRVARVADGVKDAVRAAVEQLGATNKLKGLVLDLRYAGGDGYEEAVGVADLFLKKERPLLDWGKGMAQSKEKNEAISTPVAVLVNRQTAAAAEALAGILRESGAGLILGSKTAGEALLAQEYPLRNGQRLRIATQPVKLGDGSTLGPEGLSPDIAVEVNPADERAYYEDAYKVLTRTGSLAGGPGSGNLAGRTNTANRRPRFNEAELVRERRDGFDPEAVDLAKAEPEKPQVRDPVLARALDLLKGLAVVRQARS